MRIDWHGVHHSLCRRTGAVIPGTASFSADEASPAARALEDTPAPRRPPSRARRGFRCDWGVSASGKAFEYPYGGGVMSTGAIIGIAIGAVVVLALIAAAFVVMRRRRLAMQREQAGELRREARARDLRAERQSARADEQAARAKQAQAEAEQKAAVARREEAGAAERAEVADRERRFAAEHHERAREVDPDADQETDGARDDTSARR